MPSHGPRPAPLNLDNEFGLTPGQMEVLRLVVSGMSNEEIAAKRDILPVSVRSAIGQIINCLQSDDGLRSWSRDQLIAYAKEHILKEESEEPDPVLKEQLHTKPASTIRG
jgi:DNA-binding CsgD family transcriptional regulator